MIIIKHRINTITELSLIDLNYGVEIDLRSQNLEIIMSHDPYTSNSLLFSEWIQSYRHSMLVLNIKEEGIEQQVFEIINKANIENFFCLDQSFPFIVKTLGGGENRTALRVSDYESVNTLEKTAQISKFKPNWVWIDSFTGNWEHLADVKKIKSMGYKVCIASPELHKRNLELELESISRLADVSQIDAVCTKYPDKGIPLNV
jgi:hypothetical protein